MYKIVILFCAYGLHPTSCTWETALTRFSHRGPLAECLGYQMPIAERHPIFGREYLKVECQR